MDGFNSELKKIAIALRFNYEFFYVLAKAGGANLSKDKCKRVFTSGESRNPEFLLRREDLNAVLEGIIQWQRDFDGDKESFAEAVK